MDYTRMSSDMDGNSTAYSRQVSQNDVKKKNKGGIKSFLMSCLFSSSKSKPLNQGFLNQEKNVIDSWTQNDKVVKTSIFGQKSDFPASQYVPIK